MKRVLIVSVVCLGASFASANMILNGSFEANNLAATTYDLSNPFWDASVANTHGFGAAGQMDMTRALSGYGFDGTDGIWKASMNWVAASSQGDAFSFSLSSGIVSGQSYRLEFDAMRQTSFSTGNSQILVGYSASNGVFQNQVASQLPTQDNWTHYSGVFTAGSNANFLCVAIGSASTDTWIHMDAFSLNAVPEPRSLAVLGLGGVLLIRRRRRH